MKRYKIITAVVCALVFVSCAEKASTDEEKPAEETALAAPEVKLTLGTASLSAEWEAVPGASGYRCEVTYVSGGRNVDVLKTNITGTSFTADALRPKTTYTIRVSATGKDGKASKNWFMEEKTTGEINITFDVKPYEVYNTTTGHIDYAAKVKPSMDDIWYWIGAVPTVSKLDAEIWIEDEIASALENGETWESLVESGYIVKGEAESIFVFNDSGEYTFSAGVLEHLVDKINVVSDNAALSYSFHAENFENQISHQCSYEDYLGEWVVMPYDRTDFSLTDGWVLSDPQPFTIRISEKEKGKSFNMTGWGGSANKYGLTPIVLDYAEADENRYEHFNISVPQDIRTENDVRWVYTAWLTLTTTGADGNETVQAFTPFDREYESMLSGLKEAFRGFIANDNKTVIKIFGNKFNGTGNDGTGINIYMQSLWACGLDNTGSYTLNDSKYSLNGDRGGIPNSLYYLVKKNVADGEELPASPSL